MPSLNLASTENFKVIIEWASFVRNLWEQEILFIQLQVNEILAERLFPRIAG